MNRCSLMFLLAVSLLAWPACSARANVDPNKDIEQVRAEAQRMSKSELEDICRRHVEAIVTTTTKYRAANDKLRALPYQEIMSAQANAIKTEASALSGELSALNFHYDAYLHYYLEKGGDYEKVKLPR